MSGQNFWQNLIALLRHRSLKMKLFTSIIMCYIVLHGCFMPAFGQAVVIEDFDDIERIIFTGGTGEIIFTDTTNLPPQSSGERAGKLLIKTDKPGAEDGFAGGITIPRPTLIPDDGTNTFNMWIKADPDNTIHIKIELRDDDNNNTTFDSLQDDEYYHTVELKAGSVWQLLSIPLKDFKDQNPGIGNGKLDINDPQNGGLIEVNLVSLGADSNKVYDILFDDIVFKSGNATLINYDDFERAALCFDFHRDNEPDATLLSREHSNDVPADGGDFSEKIRVLNNTLPYAGYFGYNRNILIDVSQLQGFHLCVKPDPVIDIDLIIKLQDDDNGNRIFDREPKRDDEFQHILKIVHGTNWQCHNIPLSAFEDLGAAGNGVFDPDDSNGRFLGVVFVFEDVPNATTFEIAVDNLSFLDNFPPIIQPLADTIIPAANLFQRQVQADDMDGDALVYSLVQSPLWLSIEPSSGLLSGTPADADGGINSITVQVDDQRGGISSASFTINVRTKPNIGVSPDSFSEILLPRETATQILTINNIGATADALRFDISLQSEMTVLENAATASPQGIAKVKYTATLQREGLKVAVVGSVILNPRLVDIRDKLLNTGEFESVETINTRLTTPTLEELRKFDAVLVWRASPHADQEAMGNHLADYVDAGGGVVLAVFGTADTLNPNPGLGGRPGRLSNILLFPKVHYIAARLFLVLLLFRITQPWQESPASMAAAAAIVHQKQTLTTARL